MKSPRKLNSSKLMSSLLLGVSLLTAIAPARATIYYVAVTGSDSNPGTSPGSAFATIRQGLNTAQPGDTVTMESGTYRQTAASIRSGTTSAPITLEAAEGAKVVVQGSSLISGSGFVLSSGSTYVLSSWNTYFAPNSPGQTDARGLPRDQVFVDGTYCPEATSVATMYAGSFYTDNVNKKLYLWIANGTNPSGHQVEATTVGSALLTITHAYIVVQGIEFQYCANEPQTGMFIVSGSSCIVESCTCQYAAGAGFGLENADAPEVMSCQFNNNTQEGFHSNAAVDAAMFDCVTDDNNKEPDKVFDPGWEAGGFKISNSNDFVLSNHTSMYNNYDGIWFDVSNQNAVIENCYSAFNGEGIQYEISYTATIINNICTSNSDSGINLSSSPGCYVANNLTYANAAYGITEIDPSGTNALRTDGNGNQVYCYANQYYNNIVANNQTISNKKSYVVGSSKTPDPRFSGNPILHFSPDESDYNDFYIPSSGPAFFIDHSTGYEPSTLPKWTGSTGFDTHSMWADPGLVAPASGDYELTATSPAIDTGTLLVDVPVDILEVRVRRAPIQAALQGAVCRRVG